MPTKKKAAKAKKDSPSLTGELVKQMVALSTSGFGLVSALAWNGFIQELVNNYIKKLLPNGSGLLSLFIYAIVITCLAVLVTFQLSKLLDRIQHRGK